MKKLVSFAAAVALSLATTVAFADPPMPECVDNPACNQGSSCSVGSRLAAGAPGGMGIVAIAAAALVVIARRRAR